MFTQEAVQEFASRFQAPVQMLGDSQRPHVLLPPDWTAYRQKVTEPAVLSFRTLSALVAYCIQLPKRETKEGGTLVVTVDDFASVSVRGVCEGPEVDHRRACFAQAKPHLPSIPLGQWMQLEDMVTTLSTVFEETDSREDLIALLANVEENDLRTTTDDGVSQSVAVRSGIKLAITKVPNPVVLRPFRTFHEIAQPESAFYLRMRKGQTLPEVKLEEADGGAWKREAVVAVGKWLEDQLEHQDDLVVLA